MTATLLLLMAAGCAWPRLDDRASPADALFPHGDDYDTAARHGSDALSRGVDVCGECHGRTASSAPTCASCHDAYPHPAGWRAGEIHGEGLAVKDADRSECESCHEVEGSVAAGEYNCHACHGSYPHSDTWGDAGNHGAYVLARAGATAVCGPCHGPDLEGQGDAKACRECHDSYPHGDTWAEPAAHGAQALDGIEPCQGCHATKGAWDGGVAGVACARCHASFPHSDDWLSAHLGAVGERGAGTCLGCHEAGDGAATMVAPCGASCHGGER